MTSITYDGVNRQSNLRQHAIVTLRGVATAGDTGDASPVRPTMSPLHQNDNRQFFFQADF